MSMAGSMRDLTSTIDVASGWPPNTSAWARPTPEHLVISVPTRLGRTTPRTDPFHGFRGLPQWYAVRDGFGPRRHPAHIRRPFRPSAPGVRQKNLLFSSWSSPKNGTTWSVPLSAFTASTRNSLLLQRNLSDRPAMGEHLKVTQISTRPGAPLVLAKAKRRRWKQGPERLLGYRGLGPQ